jgi:hypothetical protein
MNPWGSPVVCGLRKRRNGKMRMEFSLLYIEECSIGGLIGCPFDANLRLDARSMSNKRIKRDETKIHFINSSA